LLDSPCAPRIDNRADQQTSSAIDRENENIGIAISALSSSTLPMDFIVYPLSCSGNGMESSQLPQDQSPVLSKSNDPLKFWFHRIDTVLNILLAVITLVAAVVTWFFLVFGGVNWYYSILFVLTGYFGAYCILPVALSPLALLFWIIDSRYPLRLKFRIGLVHTVMNLITVVVLGLITWVSFKAADFLAPAWARAEAREASARQSK
jgi:hypothetical protein